jgi:hypothetical protein
MLFPTRAYTSTTRRELQVSFAEIVAEQRRKDPGAEALRRCYAAFSRMSVLNEKLTVRSGYTRGGEGGLSRTNQVRGCSTAGLSVMFSNFVHQGLQNNGGDK